MSGTLPDQIPPQTARLGRVDGDGNVIVDVNWYLFLYNVALQSLNPQNGGLTPSPTDLVLIDDIDSAGVTQKPSLLPDTQDDSGADVAWLRTIVDAQQAIIADLLDSTPTSTASTQLTPITGAGAPTDGVTGAGISPVGTGIYIDTSSPDWYMNCGTMGSPVWKLFGRAG